MNDLNENVATFFARVSAGEVSIEFVSGTIVSPEQMTDELPWDRVNLSYLHQHLTAIDENPCLIDAHNHALSDLFLVLADMPAGRGPGAVFGYAWYYGGPAIVVTETIHKQRVPTNGREQYFHTVAHELGHALLDLCHTHQTSERTDEFGGPCGVEEEVHGIRYDQTAFQAYHENYVYDADDKSVMSYQYSMSREERDSYKLESDYINCRQLYIKELDVNNCVGADIIDPNYVESPVPPEPEGLPPSPPTDVAAIGLDGEILVKWSPPFDDGGVPLTGYRIEYRDGSVTEPLGPTSNHSYRIGGLTNGVAYVVSVRAENTVGTSEAATASAVPQLEEVSGTVPGPVVDLTATGANREIRVNWSQPFDDGGIELTGYSVLYRPEGGDWERWTHSGRSTSAIITGLTAGTDYEVEVTAQNIIGHGKSEYAGASTEEDQCTAAAGEHRHGRQDLCHPDHSWSAPNPPPCLVGQSRDYAYHDPNDNDRHITRTVAACSVELVLSVWRGDGVVDDRICPVSAGCRWIVGSGSGWPAGEQFWIKCGNNVNTRENVPVPYRDRFVDSAGNLSWGQSILLQRRSSNCGGVDRIRGAQDSHN